MQAIDCDIWVSDAKLRFFGIEVGARMTVVRLPDSKLLLHSPVEAVPELVSEVRALGAVSCLVAPNRFHHLYVGGWQQACPDAAAYVVPGLDAKRSDLKIAGVLGDAAEPGWADVLDQILVQGVPLANEVVFFHRPSATLILTDLAFNVGAEAPPLTRLTFRLGGALGRVSPTRAERLLVRDRPAFRRSLERILEWPFERIVMAHGRVSERGGRAELERGYAWVLGH